MTCTVFAKNNNKLEPVEIKIKIQGMTLEENNLD